MRNFLRQDTHVWYIVENGLIITMKDGPDRTKIPNWILKMNAHEAQLFSMDDKAKNIISCDLDMNEYNRVSACEMAKEMWRLLEVTHEGTNQVKKTKINMLVQQYEAFKMKEHESINEMYSRTGHIKKYYPQLKNKSASSSGRDIKEKKFKPRKALLTWESDKETSEEDDVAQLCFMAKDDHSDKVITAENFDYNKLELAFLELSENHEKLKVKNADFKKKVLSLINTVEELEGEKEKLDEKVEFKFLKNAS
ncbi:hypothetical protein RJ640_018429 [Escallonia rubra]|uniref:Uncharacterized protein n=1 Tax=Escallonia rubra TaxID=112253 RepID=A0AA88U3S6_9ASTE|nr:hypothetical protein RJ640_018429 [Escallonia rubra]